MAGLFDGGYLPLSPKNLKIRKNGKKSCGEVTYPLFMATRLGEYTELPMK